MVDVVHKHAIKELLVDTFGLRLVLVKLHLGHPLSHGISLLFSLHLILLLLLRFLLGLHGLELIEDVLIV